MTCMIEKLAVTIDPWAWDDTNMMPTRGRVQGIFQRREESCAKARAVLEAFLEPTDGMIGAGGFCDGAENTFKAMIKADIDGK